MINFTAADRVGAIGGYIGGIATLLGGLGGLNGTGCQGNDYVSKETFEMQTKLTEAEKNNAILSADLASEKKMVEVYNATTDKINNVREELSGRVLDLERQVASNAAAQGVINCSMQSSLAVANSQIAQLMSLTMLKIPNTSVCPGWGEVKVAPVTTTTTTTG